MTNHTAEHLAEQLRKLADSPRYLAPDDRRALLRDVAEHLEAGGSTHPIDLGNAFTFVPSPSTGTLYHGDDEFMDHITEPHARQVVDGFERILRSVGTDPAPGGAS